MLSAAERVAKGVAFLDRNVPAWRSEIQKSTFDIRHTCHCILGQVFGHYITGKEKLRLDEDTIAADYGFTCYGYNARYYSAERVRDEETALQKEWLACL